MMDRDEAKERVKSATDLADWIRRDGIPLTGGGNEFKSNCPFHDDKSPSFNVFCKEGQWSYYCHGCEAKGDIFEWVMRRKSINFVDALKLVANAANIALPEAGQGIYQPPTPRVIVEKKRGVFDPDQYRAIVPGGVVMRYLVEQRKIPLAILLDYSVGETANGEAYSFAYKWRPDYYPANREKPLFEFCKVVQVARPDGKKIERRDPVGGKNILFGMESSLVKKTHAAGGELVICEGEIDAMTWAHYGYAAVSVPGGAKYLGWIDFCYDWLQAFRKIHMSMDEDAAGRLKLMEIVTRLGIARTDIVRLPLRDAETDDEKEAA